MADLEQLRELIDSLEQLHARPNYLGHRPALREEIERLRSQLRHAEEHPDEPLHVSTGVGDGGIAEDIEDLVDQDLPPLEPGTDPVTVELRALVESIRPENSGWEMWLKVRALVDDRREDHRMLRRKAVRTMASFGVWLIPPELKRK